MPQDSIDKLRKMKSVDDRLQEMSDRRRNSAKIGDTTAYYLYVDSEEIRLKSDSVGTIMHKDKTVMQPGGALSFAVPFQLVDCNKMAFHPAADQPSTAVFPHATFIPSLLDPDIKIVQGVYSLLKNLRDLI